jgi:hypothetical protein
MKPLRDDIARGRDLPLIEKGRNHTGVVQNILVTGVTGVTRVQCGCG